MSHAYPANGLVRINALRSKQLKIFALQGQGEAQPILLGALRAITTPNRQAHSSIATSSCLLVGTIQMKPVPAALLEDRSAFLRAIDMPDG